MGSIKKINVCHLASGDLWAGAEVMLTALVSGLKQYDDLNLRVILYNTGVTADRIAEAGVEAVVLDESHLSSVRLLSKTKHLLHQEKIDILHTHRYKENILGGVAARMAGVKQIVRTVHGMPEPYYGLRQLKARLYSSVDLAVCRYWVDLLVTVSDDIRRSLGSRINPGKIVTVHNGVDLNRLNVTTSSRDIKHRLGVGENEILIGSAGRLMPVKGYEYLLEAVRIMSEKRRDVRLLLIGDGPERDTLKQAVVNLGLEDHVLFHGFTPNTAELIKAMDIFVLSSLHEGISIALLEAMALGVPVVVTAVGGNREVITEGKTGLLVPSQDAGALASACLRLTDDVQLRETLSERERSLIKREYTCEVMAGKMHTLYRELVGAG
jgi:glycosyltransferase involved in cell wall biosynthesis